MKNFLISLFIFASLTNYAAMLPNQLKGLEYFRENGCDGRTSVAIVIDKGFLGFNVETGELISPDQDSGYSDISLIDEDLDGWIPELKATISKIKQKLTTLEKMGLKITIDWEPPRVANYAIEDSFTASADISAKVGLLESYLKDFADELKFVTSGHGMQVSRVVAGKNGMAPLTKIIPISTKNSSVMSMKLSTDKGDEAAPTSKALYRAIQYAATQKVDAMNLSHSINCDQNDAACISQYKLFAQLLEEAAKDALIFFALDNPHSSYFGHLPGDQLIVQAAKNVVEQHGYPRIIFVANVEEESGQLISGKAFRTADFTLSNIGTYDLPKVTNPNQTIEVRGTSFASPASMAQYLLLKECAVRSGEHNVDELITDIMFNEAERVYKGKVLPMAFYGRGFMNMSRYGDFQRNKNIHSPISDNNDRRKVCKRWPRGIADS